MPSVVAAVIMVGSGIYAGRQQSKAQKKALSAAEEQAAAEREAAERGYQRAKMSPEESAYLSMLRTRAESELGAPGFESTVEGETERGLEALQKFFMQRGFQPNPGQTGLLIEPSQRVARDVAIQNVLLKRQAEQEAWQRAIQVAPFQQRNIEQQAGLGVLPYTTQAAGYPGATAGQYAASRYDEAGAAQQALGSLLAAYSSPLLQQRISTSGGVSSGFGQPNTGYLGTTPGGLSDRYANL